LALGKTVGELLSTMSFPEYILWLQFFEKRPYGWREDLRAFRIMCSNGNMKNPKPGEYFSSLAQMEKHEAAANKRVPRKGSFAHQAIMNAKGGKKLDFLEAL